MDYYLFIYIYLLLYIEYYLKLRNVINRSNLDRINKIEKQLITLSEQY